MLNLFWRFSGNLLNSFLVSLCSQILPVLESLRQSLQPTCANSQGLISIREVAEPFGLTPNSIQLEMSLHRQSKHIQNDICVHAQFRVKAEQLCSTLPHCGWHFWYLLGLILPYYTLCHCLYSKWKMGMAGCHVDWVPFLMLMLHRCKWLHEVLCSREHGPLSALQDI